MLPGKEITSVSKRIASCCPNWPVLTVRNSGEIPLCPIKFSDAEAEECLHLEAEQNHLDVWMGKIRDRIGIGSDGWTSNERYEYALEENEHVKAEALYEAQDDVRKEILENWP